MTARFFSLLLISLTVGGYGQNLVPNPSFEEYENGCPENFNEMPVSWTRWRGSANSFSSCFEPQDFSDSLGWVPWNGFGYQWPVDGDSYVGLYAHGQVDIASSANYREYIGCELLEPLEVGETYYVSFKVSAGFFGSYYWITTACNRVGTFFTTQSHDNQENPLEIPNYSHVFTEEIIIDTVNWVAISGSFVADQPYTNIGLGVFFDIDSLEVIVTHPNPSGGLGSYYYIDDVCVSRFPNCTITSTDELSDLNINVQIYPNPANTRVVIESTTKIVRAGLQNLSGKWVIPPDIVNDYRVVFSLSDILSGTYIIDIESITGFERKKLVVVN